MAGSTARTSISEFISLSALMAPGLAAARQRSPHQRAIASSADGHIVFMSDSKPQSRSRSLDVGGARLARRRPRVVVVGVEPLRVRAVEDQRARALGVGRGEEDRHRRALRVAEQHGAAAVRRRP